MTEKEKMLLGKLYTASDPELSVELKNSRKFARLYNSTTEEEQNKRTDILKRWFGHIGQNGYIEPPFRCDYGSNIYIGDNFYANYDCIILDVCKVKIGNNVMFGPRVSVFAAAHPIDAEVRATLLEFGKAITIGDNVWIGGGTIINPGVSIGNRVVVGSGSVVTKDIPDNVVAAGNPCRIIRKITEEDRSYWNSLKEEYSR